MSQRHMSASPADIFLSGDALMCRWLMRTENAVACGAACECYKRGMLKASFSDAHKILWVNEPWEEMCGYSSDEACGQTLAMLQGPATDSVKIAKLMAEISERRPSSMVVTNYR